jgi:hypothetical protein
MDSIEWYLRLRIELDVQSIYEASIQTDSIYCTVCHWVSTIQLDKTLVNSSRWNQSSSERESPDEEYHQCELALHLELVVPSPSWNDSTLKTCLPVSLPDIPTQSDCLLLHQTETPKIVYYFCFFCGLDTHNCSQVHTTDLLYLTKYLLLYFGWPA